MNFFLEMIFFFLNFFFYGIAYALRVTEDKSVIFAISERKSVIIILKPQSAVIFPRVNRYSSIAATEALSQSPAIPRKLMHD